jgi:hypothetical protein
MALVYSVADGFASIAEAETDLPDDTLVYVPDSLGLALGW